MNSSGYTAYNPHLHSVKPQIKKIYIVKDNTKDLKIEYTRLDEQKLCDEIHTLMEKVKDLSMVSIDICNDIEKIRIETDSLQEELLAVKREKTKVLQETLELMQENNSKFEEIINFIENT